MEDEVEDDGEGGEGGREGGGGEGRESERMRKREISRKHIVI